MMELPQQTSPTETCSECGNPFIPGMNCWEQLGAVLVWEWEDSALQTEHFLTVASYNLQHPAQFTDDALTDLRRGFVEYQEQGLTAAALLKRLSGLYEGKRRVLKRAAEQVVVPRPWTLTLSHVYRPEQPQGAALSVREWAEAIRREL